MRKVRILILFLTRCKKVKYSILFVDMKHLRDWTVAMRDLVLQLTCGEIVEVHLTPVTALRIPEELIRSREIKPVHLALTRFVIGRHVLVVDGADIAGLGVSNS